MRFCVRAARPCQHWSDRVRMRCLWIQLLAFASTANTRSPLHSLWVSRHAYCDSSPRTRPSRTAGPTARRLEFRSHLRIPFNVAQSHRDTRASTALLPSSACRACVSTALWSVCFGECEGGGAALRRDQWAGTGRVGPGAWSEGFSWHVHSNEVVARPLASHACPPFPRLYEECGVCGARARAALLGL